MAKYKFDNGKTPGLEVLSYADRLHAIRNLMVHYPRPTTLRYVIDDYLRNHRGLRVLGILRGVPHVTPEVEKPRDWQDVADGLRETLESFLGRKGKKCNKAAVNAAIGILSREKGKDGVVHALESLCEKKEIDPQFKSMFDELAATVREEAEGVKKHVSRRTSQHKKGTRPGPRRSEERIDDLRRVHRYVTEEGHSLNKACEIVVAENAAKPDSSRHYASAASLRDAYPGWREECRRAGARM